MCRLPDRRFHSPVRLPPWAEEMVTAALQPRVSEYPGRQAPAAPGALSLSAPLPFRSVDFNAAPARKKHTGKSSVVSEII